MVQVKNLLKELIHDGIEPRLLDGLLETYKRNLAGDSANSEQNRAIRKIFGIR